MTLVRATDVIVSFGAGFERVLCDLGLKQFDGYPTITVINVLKLLGVG